jgi:hypothetical protein
MHKSGKLLIAGVTCAALLGGVALAKDSFKTMTVTLPDGGTAVVRYTGNVPPRISFRGTSGSDARAGQMTAAAFAGMPDPFATMERIEADMDARMGAMMQAADRMARAPMNANPLFSADLKDMPPGASSFSFASSVSGNGVCMRSTQITSDGKSAPKVVSRVSGNCGTAGAAAHASMPALHGDSALIQAKAKQSDKPVLEPAIYHPR